MTSLAPIPPIVVTTRPGQPGDDALVVRLLARLLADHDRRREEREAEPEKGGQAA